LGRSRICAWRGIHQVTSFRFDVGIKRLRASRLIGRVRAEIWKALKEEEEASGLTHKDLAKQLDLRVSELSKQLDGAAPLSLRSIAELAGALNRDISFALTRHAPAQEQNFVSETSTLGGGQVFWAGGSPGQVSTLEATPQKLGVRSGPPPKRGE
jgi:transcriptional regulator with XRE-family HTH domain